MRRPVRARRHLAALGVTGLLGLALAPAAGAATIDNSSHYYSGNGTTADGSGGPALVFHGTTAYTAGSSGGTSQAFSLDGRSYLSAPDATVANYGSRDLSAFLRFKTTSFTQMDILSKRSGCATGSLLDIRTFVSGGSGFVRAELQDASNPQTSVQVPFAFADGNFHTIFLARNGAQLTLNVDGTSNTITNGLTTLDNGAPLELGSGGCVGTDGTNDFTGAIDQVFLGVTVPPTAALPELAHPAVLAAGALGLAGAFGGLRARRRRSTV